MAQSSVKKPYLVKLLNQYDYGDGHIEQRVIAEFKTWAVSKDKAIANICYREKIKNNQLYAWSGDGARYEWLEAEEIESN